MIFLATGKVDCAAGESTLQLRRCCDWSEETECSFSFSVVAVELEKSGGSVMTFRDRINMLMGWM